MSFLGVDVGTTGCKALAFNDSGQTLACAYQEYPLLSPQPGWFELDSRGVIQHCRRVIAQCAHQVKVSDPVVALSISSQGEAFTLLDRRDHYLCNAMVSMDIRSEQQVRQFSEAFGPEKLYHITGHSPHTIFSLFKILWVKENHPELFGQIAHLLCFTDLLGYELTGEAAIGYGLAARTMLFDVHRLTWSDEILHAVGLDPRVLATPLPAAGIIGTIKKSLADELGLRPDVIVAAGSHDQSCGALGAGVTGQGLAAYATGTVECVTPAFDRLILNDTMRRSNLATYPFTIENLYTTVAYNLTGGNLLRWYRDEFARYEVALARQQNCDPYDLILQDIPAQPTSVFIQPHFAATGTPYCDPHPTGAILGVNLHTTRGQLVRAILEGVTYEMKLNVELLKQAGIPINELRAIGGGAKSSTWMQIKSDIMNIPIVALDVSESGCLGAALLAAKASGFTDSLAQTSQQWVRPVRTYQPTPQNVKPYQDRFAIYRQIYPQLKPLGLSMQSL